MSLTQRLAIYGPSTCICGNRKETVFAGRYSLTCRAHPGHPLYRGRHEAVAPEEDNRPAPDQVQPC